MEATKSLPIALRCVLGTLPPSSLLESVKLAFDIASHPTKGTPVQPGPFSVLFLPPKMPAQVHAESESIGSGIVESVPLPPFDFETSNSYKLPPDANVQRAVEDAHRHQRLMHLSGGRAQSERSLKRHGILPSCIPKRMRKKAVESWSTIRRPRTTFEVGRSCGRGIKPCNTPASSKHDFSFALNDARMEVDLSDFQQAHEEDFVVQDESDTNFRLMEADVPFIPEEDFVQVDEPHLHKFPPTIAHEGRRVEHKDGGETPFWLRPKIPSRVRCKETASGQCVLTWEPVGLPGTKFHAEGTSAE